MEFRIAPLLFAILNLGYILFVNPNLNDGIALSTVSNMLQILFPFVVIFLVATGSFTRHSYYSKQFKITFYTLQTLSILGAIEYILAIRQQHLF